MHKPRFTVCQAFDLGEISGASTFDQVRRERPRRAREADHRNCVPKLPAQFLNDGSDEGDFGSRIRNPQIIDVALGPNGFCNLRTLIR